MWISAPRLGIAPSVALVGGGALVIANLLLVVRPAEYFTEASIASAALVLVGDVVLAVGLPGARGAFGRSFVPAALVASGALGFGAMVASTLVSTGVGGGLAYEVFSSLLLAADIASLFLLLVAASAVGRSPGARRDAQRGLRALAFVALAGFAIDNIFAGVAVMLVPAENLAIAFSATLWLDRLLFIAGIVVGLWFAWPWLGPRLMSLRGAVARAYRRYVDSTP